MNIYDPLRSLVLAAAAAVLLAGCGGSDSGKPDPGLDLTNIGDNNPDIVLCMGDSITEGEPDGSTGLPWPDRLALLTGKVTVNEGEGGEVSDEGAARMDDVLAVFKPGVVTILYGANDLIHNHDYSEILDSLRSMIASARTNQTVPVIATLTPMLGNRIAWSNNVVELNILIRELADVEDVALVDLELEFGDAPADLLTSGGLHPNDLGNQVIAEAFAAVF